ncbi:MAG TPA: DUF2065 domain-containing protein [Casimicrobiaceae bacterium]|nr:DUF2065 domain-containing protein [Casimicrobiaceae bacterium]
MDSLWPAFALLLIIEGVLPFAAPRLWRDSFRKLTEMSDGQLRFIGLLSMTLGLIFLAALQYA